MADETAKASSKPNEAFCKVHGKKQMGKCSSAHLEGKPQTFQDSCDIALTVATGEWLPAHKCALAAYIYFV